MTAATTTTLVPIQPVFSDAERLALAGFLAGYRGLTREAYSLDLRQFTTWCRVHSLNLFAVRRARPYRPPITGQLVSTRWLASSRLSHVSGWARPSGMSGWARPSGDALELVDGQAVVAFGGEERRYPPGTRPVSAADV